MRVVSWDIHDVVMTLFGHPGMRDLCLETPTMKQHRGGDAALCRLHYTLPDPRFTGLKSMRMYAVDDQTSDIPVVQRRMYYSRAIQIPYDYS